MLASAMDSAFHGAPPAVHGDGADHVADIVAAVAGDKRAVIDERRTAAHVQTRDRVRAASAAAQAAAHTTAMPGELEDLGSGGDPVDTSSLPDKAELERLRGEVARRVAEMTRSMAAARDAATELADKAKGATARGAPDEAAQLGAQGGRRARAHPQMLGEAPRRAQAEVKELQARDRQDRRSAAAEAGIAAAGDRKPSIDDQLDQLKRSAPSTPPPPRQNRAQKRASSNVDDELAALKQKMAQNAGTPKRKP